MKVWTYYKERFAHMRHNAYMACVSEHPPQEDVHGRLSMWRAYGGRSGVAIVVQKEIINADNPAIQGVFSSPVGYFDDEQFQGEFNTVVDHLGEHPEIVRRYSEEFVTMALLRTLQFATLSTKHPAFREEREWRLLYIPYEFGNSPQIKEDYATISGVPQTVHKLEIRDMRAIRRVIVGPCEQPIAVRNAMVNALLSHGIGDAESRVVMSGVPLRHSSHA